MDEIPNIKLIDGRLEGKIALPVWNDFKPFHESFRASGTGGGIEKEIEIKIGGDMVIDNPSVTIQHVNAHNFLVNHAESIQHSILTRLLKEYESLRVDHYYDDEDAQEVIPEVSSIEQFKKMIGLSQIYLMNVSKNNVAYVGYQFCCSWDNEHGIGFMTHQNTIIDFGGGDTSFLTWVAEKDLKKSNDDRQEITSPKASAKSILPWWKKLFGG